MIFHTSHLKPTHSKSAITFILQVLCKHCSVFNTSNTQYTDSVMKNSSSPQCIMSKRQWYRTSKNATTHFSFFWNKIILNFLLINVTLLLEKSFLAQIYLMVFSITVNKISVKSWASFCSPFTNLQNKHLLIWPLESQLLNWRQTFFAQRLKREEWSEILPRPELKTLMTITSLTCHQSLLGKNMALDFFGRCIQFTPSNRFWKTFFLFCFSNKKNHFWVLLCKLNFGK